MFLIEALEPQESGWPVPGRPDQSLTLERRAFAFITVPVGFDSSEE